MTADAAYPAGGYPVQPRDIGLLTMRDVSGNFVALAGPIDCAVKGAAAGGLLAQFDYTTSGSTYAGRVKLYVRGTTDSVLNEAGTNDVSASVIVRITANGHPA
jgi:hypothetical protein